MLNKSCQIHLWATVLRLLTVRLLVDYYKMNSWATEYFLTPQNECLGVDGGAKGAGQGDSVLVMVLCLWSYATRQPDTSARSLSPGPHQDCFQSPPTTNFATVGSHWESGTLE